MEKDKVLRIVDSCFHRFSSDYRNDAREHASELFDNLDTDKRTFKMDDEEVEQMAIQFDKFVEMYMKDGKAGTYSRKLRTFIANSLNNLL